MDKTKRTGIVGDSMSKEISANSLTPPNQDRLIKHERTTQVKPDSSKKR